MPLKEKKILITGSAGMLASELIPVLEKTGASLILSDLSANLENKLDISDQEQVKDFVDKIKPDWIINCAAYTAVDKAEEEQELAFRVNALGPANLLAAIRGSSSALLHISSDYVFGGSDTLVDSTKCRGGALSPPASVARRKNPYRETDCYSACGIYGQSKRMGDELLARIAPEQVLILRPSWLHGIYGPNFIDTMLRLGKEKAEKAEVLRVVDDQIGSPTWTGWLAQVIVKMIVQDTRGIFHTSSRGGISWYDFAKEIFLQAEIKVDLQRQSTKELARPAPRPAYSTLDVSKLESFLAEECPSWRDCVSKHLAARKVG